MECYAARVSGIRNPVYPYLIDSLRGGNEALKYLLDK